MASDQARKVRKVPAIVANKENFKDYGVLIDDVANPGLSIPFYASVIEGENFESLTFHGKTTCRTAKILPRKTEIHNIDWLERHMRMTQVFVGVGLAPFLMILGKATHNRKELSEKERAQPDFDDVKAFIVPPGAHMYLHIGTWHDFPVAVDGPVTALTFNSAEVVVALAEMKQAGPMNQGDVFKLRLSDHFDFKAEFEDPTELARSIRVRPCNEPRELTSVSTFEPYGAGVTRKEIPNRKGPLMVVPVVNVEVFMPNRGGPGIQPHLKSDPEVANFGWREYGSRAGCARLAGLFKDLGIPATAVINSDVVAREPQLVDIIKEAGWEVGAHGLNNSTGQAGLPNKEEEADIDKCLTVLGDAFGRRPTTWLTPGFSVTKDTSSILKKMGVTTLLDFVDDDVPYVLSTPSGDLMNVPYCLETNDFSLVLTKNYTNRQYADALADHILEMSENGPEGQVLCLGMHTFVAGTPARIRALRKALAPLVKNKNIVFATADQVYKHHWAAEKSG